MFVVLSWLIMYILSMVWDIIKYVIKFPCSRGDSGALYLQSALAGVIFCVG